MNIAASDRNKGRFVKGKSGNPGGRPKTVREVEALARNHVPEVILILVQIAKDQDCKATARVAACRELLNRAIGRPDSTDNIARAEAGAAQRSFTFRVIEGGEPALSEPE